MFRFATCADFANLKVTRPELSATEGDQHLIRLFRPEWNFTASAQWGLKAFGDMFCSDKVIESHANRVLEIGAGFNTYFDRVLGPKLEYWMIDRRDYYPQEVFEAGLKQRANTRYVEGLMGDFVSGLPADYFDAVVSVSAIEHINLKDVQGCYSDMFRVTKPGGLICHTIDINVGEELTIGQAHYDAAVTAGFIFTSDPDLTWRFGPDTGSSTLTQPLDLVFALERLKGRSRGSERPYPITTINCLAGKPDVNV